MKHRVPTALLFVAAAICYVLSFSEVAAMLGFVGLLLEAKAWSQAFSDRAESDINK